MMILIMKDDDLDDCKIGIARGCGWQKMGALINFVSFYIVGLPISCILAFRTHLGPQVGARVSSFMYIQNNTSFIC
jgi:MATE family multidrug resistance protein